MTNRQFIEDLGLSLKEDNTHANREKWARFIIKYNFSLIDLAVLLNSERVIAMRFMWLIGHICDLNPGFVYPYTEYFFSKRSAEKFADYKRSLARMFYLSGVPKEIEGEAIHVMFNWLLDAKANVSTKDYCLKALEKLSEQHMDLKNELKMILEEQQGRNTAAFDRKIEKSLKKLNTVKHRNFII